MLNQAFLFLMNKIKSHYFCRALQLSYNSTAKTKKEKENVFICIVNTVTKIIEC